MKLSHHYLAGTLVLWLSLSTSAWAQIQPSMPSQKTYFTPSAQKTNAILKKTLNNPLLKRGRLFAAQADDQSDMITQYWDGADWINSQRLLYTRGIDYDQLSSFILAIQDLDHSKLESFKNIFGVSFPGAFEVFQQYWEDGNWVTAMKITGEDDGQGRLGTLTLAYQEGDGWRETVKIGYTYDDSDRVLTMTVQAVLADGLPLADVTRFTNTYSETGLLTFQSMAVWVSSWTETTRRSISYDANGYVDIDRIEMGIQGIFRDFSRLDFDFDADGKRQQLTVQYAEQGLFGSTWVNKYRQQLQYSGVHLTQELYQAWRNEAWSDSTREDRSYTGDNWTSWLRQVSDGNGWDNESQGSIIYNAGNEAIQELTQTWEGQWVNSENALYTWEDGRLTAMTSQFWAGEWINSERYLFNFDASTAVEEDGLRPITLELANYPNPFNPSTTIRYGIPASGNVSVAVYNLMGQKVKTLILSELTGAGRHEIMWDATDERGLSVPSGLYFYQIRWNGQSCMQRCLLLK